MDEFYNIFIFRRDLRLYDNKGLNYCINNYKNILPIFIFTKEQVNVNKYKSNNAVEFMIDCLYDINTQLKNYKSNIHLYEGDNINILKKLINKIKVNSITFNMDFTPYAKKRDKDIALLCKKNNITCNIIQDYTCFDINSILNNEKKAYVVYSAFKRKFLEYEKINKIKINKIKIKNLVTINNNTKLFNNKRNLLGGRNNALNILKNSKKTQFEYNEKRNDFLYESTRLSPYIKFGCLSIREVFIFFISKDFLGIIHQLIWREFYYVLYYFNNDLLKGKNFNKKTQNIKWNNDYTLFKKWCEGKTGIPIIDASMIKLNTEGYINNRSRLVVANFLSRILHINWRWGEKYFATKLTDYDPILNNANWSYVTSTGVDRAPHSQRIFNPWLQSKNYGKDCKFIKKYIPSLKDIPNKHIHKWYKYHSDYENIYLKPIITYEYEKQKSIKIYNNL